MRIVVWNCAKAMHKKFDRLLTLQPDIAVVSECADPEILSRKCDLPAFSAPAIWSGGNPNWTPDMGRDRWLQFGLTVFVFNGAAGNIHSRFNRGLNSMLPVEVTSPRRFNLLAVCSPTGLRKADPGPLRRALEFYRPFLTGEDAVIAGDFNNNINFDAPGRESNHSNARNVLESYRLISAYHAKMDEDYGGESQPTHYHRWRHSKNFHIDFIYVPRAWAARDFSLDVGSFDDWTGAGLSDHVPLTLDIGCP